MKLPELLGSEKQVKWANDIRHEYIDQLAQDEKLVEKYLELKVMFNYLKIRWNDKIASEKSSAWYIDHRLNKKF